MRNHKSNLEQFLHELAHTANAGDRLPTIRELMHRFGVSQVVVQRAYEDLRAQGLIASHVGRGTYFRSSGDTPTAKVSASPLTRSVLLFRRSYSVVRGRLLVEGLQRRFTNDGHRVLEVSYTDVNHALTVLTGLPHFDACVIQSTFQPIPINVLSALREKCDVLAVDGAALVGADVEAVGTEWGEPLTSAIELLRQQGHRSIAYATTSHPFLANLLGLRRFEYLKERLPDHELHKIIVPGLHDGYEVALAGLIKEKVNKNGRLPFTALVVWGIEDGAKFRMLLEDIGVEIPSALSVILLGRTDVPSEHANFFNVIGSGVEDQINYLHETISARWADPTIPYGLRFTPVITREGASVKRLTGRAVR